MHPEMKSRSKKIKNTKKNCYSLTIKLQFFFTEMPILFFFFFGAVRKNMSACDFQGSEKKTHRKLCACCRSFSERKPCETEHARLVAPDP